MPSGKCYGGERGKATLEKSKKKEKRRLGDNMGNKKYSRGHADRVRARKKKRSKGGGRGGAHRCEGDGPIKGREGEVSLEEPMTISGKKRIDARKENKRGGQNSGTKKTDRLKKGYRGQKRSAKKKKNDHQNKATFSRETNG